MMQKKYKAGHVWEEPMDRHGATGLEIEKQNSRSRNQMQQGAKTQMEAPAAAFSMENQPSLSKIHSKRGVAASQSPARHGE